MADVLDVYTQLSKSQPKMYQHWIWALAGIQLCIKIVYSLDAALWQQISHEGVQKTSSLAEGELRVQQQQDFPECWTLLPDAEISSFATILLYFHSSRFHEASHGS